MCAAMPLCARLTAVVSVGAMAACHPAMRVVQPETGVTVREAALWAEPEPDRDLYCGVGGCELAPNPEVPYTILSVKTDGYSAGFTLSDPAGHHWSAKLKPEARTEIVASRLLWGLGYHQAPAYYLDTWEAAPPEDPAPRSGARFREKSPPFHGLKEQGDWSYYRNPFVGSAPMSGLLVLHVMLGSCDLKDSNNAIYTLKAPVEGAAEWYVARDIGQSFGRATIMNAPRGDIDAFEETGFITDVRGGIVHFDWGGRQKALVSHITPADVRWICGRFARLTDRQWHDAFRAGGFAPDIADRFIRHMKGKIAAGLRLES